MKENDVLGKGTWLFRVQPNDQQHNGEEGSAKGFAKAFFTQWSSTESHIARFFQS